MRCNEVQNLMPLYAGQDLASLRERELIDTHLEDCQSCRSSASEWAESQQFFQAFAPAEFDAEFFDGIRGDVLREINQGSSRESSRFLFLLPGFRFPLLQAAGLFSRRLAIASTLCLLVLAGVLTFRFYQSSSKLRAVAIDSGVAFVGNAKFPWKQNVEVGHPGSSMEKGRRKPQRRRFSSIDQPSRDTTKESTVNSASGVGEIAASATRDSIVRIEIQTRDPNIRIIWLKAQVDTTSSKIQENR